jgi:hypothetical protein
MSALPAISSHERYWNAEIARRRPDLVSQEVGPREWLVERYLELAGSTFGAVAHVLTDRARVVRHLIDRNAERAESSGDPASDAAVRLTQQVGPAGAWTEPQADRLAALIGSHPGAQPEIMATGDGTIVVSFGPRRGNGAYVIEPEGRSRWVTPKRYAV